MYEIPLNDAFALLEVHHKRVTKDADRSARQQDGGLKAWHRNRVRRGHQG